MEKRRTARRNKHKCLIAATALGLGTALAAFQPPQHAGAAPVVLTDQQIAALDPVAQAALFAPLNKVADALGGLGRTTWSSSFSTVAVDANHGQVDLFMADPSRASAMIAAAQAKSPGFDSSLIVARPAAASLAAMHAARDSFLAKAHSYAVYAVAVAADGSGLQVEVHDPAAVATPPAEAVAGAPAVALEFVRGTARQPKYTSWDAVKWHDSAPFIGGDYLTTNGLGTGCTAGLPAVRNSDGHAIMITANHCFQVGQGIYTGAGPTFQYNNGLTGNTVGTTIANTQTFDAIEIYGADNNADESDTGRYLPLTSTDYSYNGQYVCHDGQRSAALGHETPCGIKVTKQDTYFAVGGYMARGVEGVDVNNWGSVGGDSGATVFASTGSTRQARGIVSTGGADNTADQKRVDWTEATDIFNTFGLRLNPTT